MISKTENYTNYGHKQAHVCQYAVCSQPEHPLVGLEQVVESDLFATQAVILSGMREFFETQNYIEVPDYETAIALVRGGSSWCLLPMELAREDIQEGRLMILNHVSAVSRVPVTVYWHNDHAPAGVALELVNEVSEVFASLDHWQ
ncbi:MAG: LysR substrate-binding domain-containing protein [Endozoicomonas sp.]